MTDLSCNAATPDMPAPVSVSLLSQQYDTGVEALFRDILPLVECAGAGIVASGGAVGDSNAFDFSKISETTAPFELLTDGTLSRADGRVTLCYDESALTGMEGSTTTLSFPESDPSCITMLRYGTVSTKLIFEAGRRYICTYDTGVGMDPFELCAYTTAVHNSIGANGGRLELDYFIEIRGSTAERTKLKLEISPRADGEGQPAGDGGRKTAERITQ